MNDHDLMRIYERCDRVEERRRIAQLCIDVDQQTRKSNRRQRPSLKPVSLAKEAKE